MLESAPLDEIVTAFNNAFQQMDYNAFTNLNEHSVRRLIQFLILGADVNVDIEVHNAHGRSDMEIPIGSRRWVFEMKCVAEDNAADKALAEALDQIATRRYGKPDGRELLRAGIVFSRESRTFAAWKLLD